ncbi:MAG: alpha-glucan family phosphorylase [Terracidiphilus sp.]
MNSKADASNDNAVLDSLTELALNLDWSWSHSADDLWRQLDPELWTLTHNPWVILQTVSSEKLQSVTSTPQFKDALGQILESRSRREEAANWFQHSLPEAPLSRIAYFSMEFMLSDALPVYSGGLGNVAGDQLKAASDLGLPVTGIGLLYQRGYFRQHINAEGMQEALYPFNEPGQLPVRPVRQPDGELLRLAVNLPGFRMWLRAWEVRVGRVQLYLLDTNDPANPPTYRGITSELYGGGPEVRIAQEMVLGIGGWRLLRALGKQPEVCHLNEGHAAFAVLERARDFMDSQTVPFDVALAATRAGNLFTTHTPVVAGFDRFTPQIMATFFRHYAADILRIPIDKLLALGRQNPQDSSEPFNMAFLAMRGSGAVNGVSRLHGHVSRGIFHDIFPRWPEAEVPVDYVTNGVHVPVWDSAHADELWTEVCGKRLWTTHLKTEDLIRELGLAVRQVSDVRLWQMRSASRKSLIDYIRRQLARQIAGHGGQPEDIDLAQRIFEPDVLTIGFARRFATYKRPNLLLHDPERLLAILTNKEKPVQLVIAGKAHPQDHPGQEMIERWIEFIRRGPARSHVVFLADYDMRMAEHLVQGVDLWLNTPRRPWEACGTSGMKVLVNGGLNLSELDGWWAEAYSQDVGWALGDGLEHGDDPAWDAKEAEQLYTLLEQEVIPEYYKRGNSGIPAGWIARVRESMARLTPAFSATRCVLEYTEKYYLPLAAAYLRRADDGGKVAKNLLQWKRHIVDHWSRMRFGSVHIVTTSDQHHFDIQVYLDEMDPGAIQVELYADAANGDEPIRQVMVRGESLVGQNVWCYSASVPAARPAEDFTPRIVPYHPDAFVPLEAPDILWYK